MKRILSLAVALCSLCFAASAQLGVVGGLTSSSTHIDVNHFDYSTVYQYHAGVTYNMNLGDVFSIQPSLLYQVKGSELDQVITENSKLAIESNTGYLELPVALKAGVDLLAFKPYVFVEPFVGYALTSQESLKGEARSYLLGDINEQKTLRNKWKETAKKRLEYGFGIGAGVEFLGHFQLSAQYFMNLGKLYDEDGSVDGNAMAEVIKASYKDAKNYQGIRISLALMF